MSFSRQFYALLRKNFLLQTRARKNWLGLTSWGALALEILLPVFFFLILWLPRQFAPLPRPTPVQLSVPLPLESNQWGEIYTGGPLPCPIAWIRNPTQHLDHETCTSFLIPIAPSFCHWLGPPATLCFCYWWEAGSSTWPSSPPHDRSAPCCLLQGTPCSPHEPPSDTPACPPGPAKLRGFQAHVAFAPNGSAATAFMHSVAASLACPSDPSFKAEGTSFFPALFRAPNPQAACDPQAACLADTACQQHVWQRNLRGFATPEEANDWALQNPFVLDAIIELQHLPGQDASNASLEEGTIPLQLAFSLASLQAGLNLRSRWQWEPLQLYFTCT